MRCLVLYSILCFTAGLTPPPTRTYADALKGKGTAVGEPSFTAGLADDEGFDVKWIEPRGKGSEPVTLKGVTADFTLLMLIDKLKDEEGIATSDNLANGLRAKWLKPSQRLKLDDIFGTPFKKAHADLRVIEWKGGLKGGIWNTVRRSNQVACVC